MLRLQTLRARALRPCSFRSSLRLVSTAPPLIRIKDATFYKSYPTAEDKAKDDNPPLFPKLNFTLPSTPGKEGRQHWVVIGEPARSDFLDVLRGSHICVPPNARSYPYLLTDEIAKKDPRLRYSGNAIQYIDFSGEGSGAIGGTRGAYLSARYESLREETDWTVQQYLRGQTSLNPLEEDREGTVHDEELFSQVTTELRLGELLDMPVANLSNGQTRRTRIAKALLGKPELLLLDDPFMGLDPATVRSISDLLHRLADKADPRLVLSLRPQDQIPDWITHVLIVGKSNSVLFQGSRTEATEVFGIWKELTKIAGRDRISSDERYNRLRDQAKEALASGKLDRQLITDLQSNTRTVKTPEMSPIKDGEPLVEMDGVRVQYGDKVVLGNWTQNVRHDPKPGLSWMVRRGQRWAILGPNGSGKTTLLSLITSDHPQAYALPIKLFGRSRLPEPGKPAISLFELQSRLGHSSPEIHAFFPRQLTVRQAVESAFAETFLSKPALDHERDQDVSAALLFFKPELDSNFDGDDPSASVSLDRQNFPRMKRNLDRHSFFLPDQETEYADSITFGQLSTPQQRLVLFLRALIHKPDIIILDEPFSGMSSSVRDKCIQFLEVGQRSGVPTTATRRGASFNSAAAADVKLGTPTPEGEGAHSEGEKAQSHLLPKPKGYVKKADRHKYEGFLLPRPKGYVRKADQHKYEGFGNEKENEKELKLARAAPAQLRHRGITKDQALIMISHVREEIPDIVRHYMRLPTTAEGDDSGLDFRFGYLKLDSALSAPGVWDLAWTPKDQFVKKGARKNFRRVDPNKWSEEIDENVFEYYSI